MERLISMNSLVGTNISNGNIDRAEKIGWVGAFTAGAVVGLVGILLALFPQFWISIFTDEPNTIAAAKSYFQITAPFFGFLGMGLSLYFASQGARAVGWPVVGTIFRFIIGAGGSFILVEQFNAGIEALFWCVSAGIVVYWITICASLYLGAWRKPQ